MMPKFCLPENLHQNYQTNRRQKQGKIFNSMYGEKMQHDISTINLTKSKQRRSQADKLIVKYQSNMISYESKNQFSMMDKSQKDNQNYQIENNGLNQNDNQESINQNRQHENPLQDINRLKQENQILKIENTFLKKKLQQSSIYNDQQYIKYHRPLIIKQKSIQQKYDPKDLFSRISNVQRISKLFNKKMQRNNLLYKQDQGRDLRKCIQNKKNLLLVCRLEDDTIFGGFSQNGFYEYNNQVFVYIMQYLKQPKKILSKRNQKLISIQERSYITFGKDLVIALNKNNNCFLKIAQSYSIFKIKKQIIPQSMKQPFKYISLQIYEVYLKQ